MRRNSMKKEFERFTLLRLTTLDRSGAFDFFFKDSWFNQR